MKRPVYFILNYFPIEFYNLGNILCFHTLSQLKLTLKPGFSNILKCLSVFDGLFLVSFNILLFIIVFIFIYYPCSKHCKKVYLKLKMLNKCWMMNVLKRCIMISKLIEGFYCCYFNDAKVLYSTNTHIVEIWIYARQTFKESLFSDSTNRKIVERILVNYSKTNSRRDGQNTRQTLRKILNIEFKTLTPPPYTPTYGTSKIKMNLTL